MSFFLLKKYKLDITHFKIQMPCTIKDKPTKWVLWTSLKKKFTTLKITDIAFTMMSMASKSFPQHGYSPKNLDHWYCFLPEYFVLSIENLNRLNLKVYIFLKLYRTCLDGTQLVQSSEWWVKVQSTKRSLEKLCHSYQILNSSFLYKHSFYVCP